MKVRKGFVSNSSSSSFIVAAKDITKLKIEFEVDLTEFTNKTITSIEDLETYFSEYYGWKPGNSDHIDNDYYSDTHKQCAIELNKGNTIFFGGCEDFTDNEIELYIHKAGVSKITGLTVIEDNNGY